MPFVKLDCGVLNSTIWYEKNCRDVFLTALLMAEPFELTESTPQIEVDSLQLTGWIVPPGWYGFVPAAGIGIIHRAQVDPAAGLDALRALGAPEDSSRTPDHGGRRLARIDGGYLILNFMKYRDRDYTSAERSRRYRERVASRRSATTSHRDITQAEAEAEAEAEQKPTPAPDALRARFDRWWASYPSKQRIGKGAALKLWTRLRPSEELADTMVAAVERQRQSAQWTKDGGAYIPHARTWLSQGRWEDGGETEAQVVSERDHPLYRQYEAWQQQTGPDAARITFEQFKRYAEGRRR